MKVYAVALVGILASGCRGMGAQELSTVRDAEDGDWNVGDACAVCGGIGNPSADEAAAADERKKADEEQRTKEEEAEREFQEKLTNDANLTYNKAVMDFVSKYPTKFQMEGTDSAPFGSKAYWDKYVGLLGSMYKAEKAANGGQPGPNAQSLAEDISLGLRKASNAAGHEVIEVKHRVLIEEIGETSDTADSTSSNSVTTMGSTSTGALPGGEVGMQVEGSSSRGAGRTVTRKDKEAILRVEVTYKGKDGEPAVIQHEFLHDSGALGAGAMAVRGSNGRDGSAAADAGENRAEQRRQADEAARAAQLAELAERRRREIEEFNALPEHVVMYQKSTIDGLYHRLTDEMRRAYDFLDYAYVTDANARIKSLRILRQTLAERRDAIVKAQASTKALVGKVATSLGVASLGTGDAASIAKALNDGFAQACQTPTLGDLPDYVKSEAIGMKGRGALLLQSAALIEKLQDVSHVKALWTSVEAEVASIEREADEARALVIDRTLCDKHLSLYRALSLKVEQAHVNAASQAVKELLAKLKIDVQADETRRAEEAFKAAHYPKAKSLIQSLKNARILNEYFTAATTAVRIKEAKAVLPAGHEVAQLYDSALAEWNAYLAETPARVIVLTRASDLTDIMQSVRAGLALQDHAYRKRYLEVWMQSVAASGLVLHEQCYDRELAIAPSCWQVVTPKTDDLENLEAFDFRLGQLATALEVFAKTVGSNHGQ